MRCGESAVEFTKITIDHDGRQPTPTFVRME